MLTFPALLGRTNNNGWAPSTTLVVQQVCDNVLQSAEIIFLISHLVLLLPGRFWTRILHHAPQ